MILEIFKEEDRLQVAAILVKNGYTVRQGKKRKTPTGKAYTYFIEYTKTEEAETDES